MKRSALIWLLIVMAWALGVFIPNGFCFAQATQDLKSKDIPVPPEQAQPWTPPPTKLPPLAVSAITELFNEGLADPRGCEYREIEVEAGIELTIKTHGWILPGTGQSRFAVGWNGLVYPVVTIGSPADLQKDVADLVAKDRKQWSSYTGTNRDVRGNWTAPEWVSVSCDNLLPIKAAILLRLGRAELAESVWNRWFALSTDGEKDPYLLLAREWTESFYNRALFAHLRGDDAVSLAACRTLVPLRSTVEAAAAQRGFAKDASGKPYLEDLEQLPKLAADQERRAQEPPYVPVLQSGQPAQGQERIAALIHDLELVSARQEMNPGQTDVSTDPIVAALIKEGDPAVEPLLKCFEEDTRLTRSEFTQGMQIRPGPIIPVYEPAFAAIVGILKTPFYFSDSDNNRASDVFREPSDPRDRQPRDLSMADRKFLAAKIREYWQKNKGMSLSDRWYATLQDDNAGASAWFLAIANIVQPTDVSTTPRTMFGGGWSSGGGFLQKAPVVLQGESLRAKTNPSVSDLIIKRFGQLVATDAGKGFDVTNLSKLLFALASWDGKNHLDDLRKLGGELNTKFIRDTGKSSEEVNVTLCEERFELGDAMALSDYVSYIESLTVEELKPASDMSGYFEMMWRHPNDPMIQQAAQKIFADKDSLWQQLNDLGYCPSAELLKTPLIGLAAYREEVERELGNSVERGTVKLFPNGNVSLTRNHSTTQEPNILSTLDPLAPAGGAEVSFRLCDYDAFRLSKVDGFPECQPYWPLNKRDQAVAACRAILRQYGDNFQFRPGNTDFRNTFGNVVQIHFPKLDHPATPDDVKLGHAIFALSGTTRICHLPDFPLEAWRPNRKTDPSEGDETTADGTSKRIIIYNTEGRVWQAEEVLRDGKWERYYGFVGRYQLEKVSAAEIKFSYQGADGNITKEISGTIEGPEDYVHDQPNFSFATHNFAQLGAPLPVKVKVSNGSGLDQVVPPALMLPPGAKMKLPQGISLSLSYSEKIPPKVISFSEPPFNYGSWQDVPLRQEVQIEASNTPGPTLIPTQDFTVLDVDLRDFFDMSRPGTYRVKALFHLPGQAADQSNEVTFSVANRTN
jgi:hypothetical protein